MILALVRHGETDQNKLGIVQGRIDNPLNELGQNQAKELGLKLRNEQVKFDHIIASPLIRAKQTASIIQQELNSDIHISFDERFLERDFHHLDGKHVSIAMPFVRTKGYTYEGYEDDIKLVKRISEAVLDLEKRYPNQNILLVTHSHVIKALYVYIDPIRYSFLDIIQNGEIRYFKIQNQKIEVIE